MLSYRATLDVPSATVRVVSRWLAVHRRAHDARPHQRAATPWVQAVMVLRWLIEATSMRTLARDAGVSIASRPAPPKGVFSSVIVISISPSERAYTNH